MAPHVHAVTKTRKIPTDRPSEAIDQSSIIINTLKEEIGRSQEVLLGRITQLEEKCNAVHEQQAALRWTIEIQIVPYMCTMSELLVDVCEQLAKTKVINWPINSKPEFNAFDTRQPLLIHHFLLRFFFFFSMNSDASEFFPSNETEIRSTTVEEEDLLGAWLKTDHQLATAKSILQEWSTSTTLSNLTREWSIKHENRSIERNSFSLLLYNISSLRMHLEDLIGYISASYPDIWALTGLHFNDDVNYQLASHFKSR